MTKFDEWYLRFGGNGAMMQLSSVCRKAHGLLSFLRNDKEGSKKIRISEKCVCYCEASAHTGCGNLSPTVEQQISSTGRVAAALIEVSQFPASTNFRRKLLYTTKEVLNP